MQKHSNQIRIIGGQHRGRKLAFVDAQGLRPTPDRVRETLFNWLMPVIAGSRCLDLFAGSGALGFEAWSRGARQVVLVDSHPPAVRGLRDNLGVLASAMAGEVVSVVQSDGLAFLNNTPAQGFDIVFLDPPYRANLLPDCIARLESGGWLRDAAWIYLEAPQSVDLPTLPPNWQLRRSKRAGQVGYHLLYREAPAA